MKRIALSLMTIAMVALMAVGATNAYFNDSEAVLGNTFAAGSLDLQIGAGNPMPFAVSNMYPGQTGTGKVTLTNATGSLDGALDLRLSNFVQAENGLTEPELQAGDYENGGDLYLSFEMAAYLDVNQNGAFDTGDFQLAYNGQKAAYPGFWGGDFHYHPVTSNLVGWNDVTTLTQGQSVDVVVMWQMPTVWTYPNYNQNIVQTDSLGFDLLASLEQVNGSGGVTE